MAGKKRVHELAKELGTTSKSVIAWLVEQGESGKSASSTIEAPVARRFMESYHAAPAATEAPTPPTSEEPPYTFVRERASSTAHHWDYLDDRNDEALCGHEYGDPITLGEELASNTVCPACEARLPEYHARWWRSEFEALRMKYAKLEEHSKNQRMQLAALQAKSREAKQSEVSPAKSATKQRQSVGPVRSSAKPARAMKEKSTGRPNKKKKGLLQKPPQSPLGIPLVTKQQVDARVRAADEERRRRFKDPDAFRKRSNGRTSSALPRPKTAAEKASDEAARDRMRSQKPTSWRVGRSPGSYR